MSTTEIGQFAIKPHGPRFAQLSYEDREEIHGVLSAYGRLYDDNRMDDFLGLLTDEAVFYPNWPGMAPEEVCVKTALGEFFGSWRNLTAQNSVEPHHFATNVIITNADEATAQATVSMLYTESTGGKPEVTMTGQYDYSLVKQEDRWFIDGWSMRYDK